MKPVLLITGASRGIGAATALLAAQHGWSVAVNYAHNAVAAHAVVTQIQNLGGTALAIQADVGDEAQILRMFAEVDAKLGRLSGLVNNAGVISGMTPNQAWNAGRAWLSSMPRPFTVRCPLWRAAARSGVSKGM